MNDCRRLLWLVTGIVLGIAGTALYLLPSQQAIAANDRFEDYILCTGAVATSPSQLNNGKNAPPPTDGVWLLDYRSGKLLGTVIDRLQGRILGWAELDMVAEFNLKPRAPVHFLMTTGTISKGQSALYIAETTSGKLGIYTMGPRVDGQQGVAIRRHDMETFRQVAQAN